VQHLTGSTLSDDALMSCIVRRDEDALVALYERYRVLAFAIALRITDDYAIAEEVLQDVFLGVWRTAATFRPSGCVKAWLSGIAQHRAIDATRAAAFRAREREQYFEPDLELSVDDELAEQVARHLDGEHVRAALEQLPSSQREALTLAYYGGMSQAEIAAQLNTPIGTVKTRQRLGLTRLRQMVSFLSYT
jgi:RNA polymerase sigma-70 factor (ECF subfamily)